MKRVLCLLSSMNAGGAETFLMKLYRQLDRTKYQMDFCINVKEKCFYEEEILSLGGKIYRIPSKSENRKQFKTGLSNIVKENSYEYVLRITSNAMGFMDLKVAKKAGAKICSARSSNSSDGKGIKKVIAHKIGNILYKKYVDVKFAPSDLAAKYTFGEKDYKNGKVSILHNGVDLNVYKYNNADAEQIRKEFGIDDGYKIIGHVGRFMEQKNHKFLLNVFAEIKLQLDKVKLLLIGDGVLKEKIEQQSNELGISRDVIFTGVRSDVPKLMSAMDVFVFPSFFEGMPNTVIEAQAMGLPCVISDTITKEANITGLVEYLSLEESVKNWADIAIAKIALERKDTKEDFVRNEYEINSVVNKFVKLVFGE